MQQNSNEKSGKDVWTPLLFSYEQITLLVYVCMCVWKSLIVQRAQQTMKLPCNTFSFGWRKFNEHTHTHFSAFIVTVNSSIRANCSIEYT